MRFLAKLNDGFARVEGFLLVVFLMTMLGLAFLQVVMRNFFNSGIPWADSVVRVMVLWVGFLGAVLATRLDQLLTVEVLTKYMPGKGRHMMSVVVKLFAIVVCYFLLQASLRFLASEQTTGEEFVHLFPAWWTLTIIPVTMILIPFHLLFNIARDIQSLAEGKP